MRRCLLFLIAFVLLFDMFSGFAFAQNYDDEQLTLNIATSCSAMEYNAGKPIVFTVEILDGNPPFQYSWELGETFNYSSRSLLEEYICNDAFVVSLPHGTTYSRRIEFTYTPPVLGHDLTAVCYIVDRDGRDVEAHVGAFSPISWATTYAQFVLDGGFLYDDYLPNTQLGVSAFYDNELNEIDDLYNSWRPLSFSLYVNFHICGLKPGK